jgi:hypothetical protein
MALQAPQGVATDGSSRGGGWAIGGPGASASEGVQPHLHPGVALPFLLLRVLLRVVVVMVVMLPYLAMGLWLVTSLMTRETLRCTQPV